MEKIFEGGLSLSQVFFNSAGCGVALPLDEGNSLVTSGVISCVVLQVLSDNHFFGAHLMVQDTEDSSKLREFCSNIRDEFNSHNSNIQRCTLWYSPDKYSKPHAERILGTIQEILAGRTWLEAIGGGGIEFSVNSEREIVANAYSFNGNEILLVPDETYEDQRRSEREKAVNKALCKNGYNNGFAIGIYEIEEEFEIKNDYHSLIQNEDEENDEPRGFLRRLFSCCGCIK